MAQTHTDIPHKKPLSKKYSKRIYQRYINTLALVELKNISTIAQNQTK